jgi:hypothetical protein
MSGEGKEYAKTKNFKRVLATENERTSQRRIQSPEPCATIRTGNVCNRFLSKKDARLDKPQADRLEPETRWKVSSDPGALATRGPMPATAMIPMIPVRKLGIVILAIVPADRDRRARHLAAPRHTLAEAC